MKKFDIYQHPVKGYEAVKEGFSWPGFLFGVIWCFAKGLLGWGFGLLAIAIVLSLLIDNDTLLTVISLGVSFSIGNEGNGWRRDRLSRRGYHHIGRFEARNSGSAIAEAVGSNSAVVPEQAEPLKALS
jgi:hypothetical protein